MIMTTERALYGTLLLNMRSLRSAALIAVGVVMNLYALSAYAGTTYYKIGQDAANESSFTGTYSGGGTAIGWATSRDATSTVTVEDMENSDFVVISGSRLRTDPRGGAYTFAGRSLVLETGGLLMIKSGEASPAASTITVAKLVGAGGSVMFNAAKQKQTLAGAAEIEANSSLTVDLNGDGQNAVVSSTITGDDTTTLYIKTAAATGSAGQVLEIADAAGFYGTIAESGTSDEPFTLKLTGGFGGTITSLPRGMTSMRVNYDGLSSAKGLCVATTTIPEVLKTAVVFYSAGGISADTVLMTFPAGTTVDEDEFTVKFATAVNGTPTEFRCRKAVDDLDGTVRLFPVVTTYYKIGVDVGAANCSSFGGTYVNQSGTIPEDAAGIGWATLRDATSTNAVSDMASLDFVVQSGATLRTPPAGGTHTFGGRSLTLESGGLLMTKCGDVWPLSDSTINIANLVADGGTVMFNVARYLQTLAGTVSVKAGSSLALWLNSDGQKAVVSSALTGDDTTALYILTAASVPAESNGQSLELSDAADFYGTIATNNYSSEPFTLKLTGGFGGTVTSLPKGTTQVLVNYDALSSAAGLRVATTTIPPALKTAVTFYSATEIPDGAVLMTFPAGAVVDPAEFSVHRTVGVDGAARRIAKLAAKVNGDGTISLLRSSNGFIIQFK